MTLNLNTTLSELVQVAEAFRSQSDAVHAIGTLLIQSLRNGNKVLTCGNGGSAADALHMAEELIGRYKGNRPSLAGISLCADVTALTCIANDFGFEQLFARQVEGLGKAGDILVGFTTSGNSSNIQNAFAKAQELNVKTVLLSGESGGICQKNADHSILVPSKIGARIQEIHTLVMHHWLEMIEHEQW